MDRIEAGRAPHRLARLLVSGARKLRTAFADLWERQAWRAQFDAWERRREIDSVLEALGLERGEVPRFVKRIPAATRLLPEMTARSGAQARLGADAPPRLELLRVCALCPDQARCRKWLASGATTGFEAFCPNAPVFATAAPVRAMKW